MSTYPLLSATCKVTAKDINNNSVAKQFNAVKELKFDYASGRLNVLDATGSFYFQLTSITALTYTVVTGANGNHAVVVS
jgi:hypothetical protein